MPEARDVLARALFQNTWRTIGWRVTPQTWEEWPEFQQRCLDEAAAGLAALDAAGFVVVPREPTEAMIDAGYGRCFDESGTDDEDYIAVATPEECWRAMVAAAQGERR